MTDHYVPSYPMNSRPRGQALVINCVTFNDRVRLLEERHGADIDEGKLSFPWGIYMM